MAKQKNQRTYSKITKEFAVSYAIQLITIIVGFLIFPVLTRYLSVEDYGLYSLLITSLNLMNGIISMGLGNFVERDLTGKSKKYQQKKISIISSFYLINTIILASILLIFLFINKKSNWMDSSIVVYLFISLVMVYYSNLLLAYVKSQLKIKKNSILSYLAFDGWYIFVILFALVMNQLNLNLIFLLKALTSVVFTVMILFSIKEYKKNFKFNLNKDYIKKGLVYGLPFVPIVASQWIITASDRYFIKIFSTDINLGYYSYIYALVAFISTIGKQIIYVLRSYIIEAKNKKQEGRVNFLFNASIKYSLMITLPAIAGLFVMRNEIITLLSGPKYLPALYILPILISYPLFRIINLNLENLLILKKSTKKIGMIYIIGTVMNILLNFILIPKYNILGAACSTMITYIIMTFTFIVVSRGGYKLNFSFLKMPQILISSVLMYIALSFIHPHNFFTKILTMILGAILYFSLIFITRGYVKEEKELIKKILKIRKN